MKKILMVAMLSTIAMGAFATGNKPKKHKSCEHCTQTHCSPDCHAAGCCHKPDCTKA